MPTKEDFIPGKPITPSLAESIAMVMEGYSEKNPKIEIYHKGIYKASTNFSPTLKHAKEGWLAKHPEHSPEDIKTYHAASNAKKSEEIAAESINEATNPWKMYLRNEDKNYHSGNVLHMAKHVGDEADVKAAKDIIVRHKKEGSMYGENQKDRKTLDDKLWPKFHAKFAPK